VQRNYQTRSEEKREKPFKELRKFTAVDTSKFDSLDLFPYPRDKGEADIGDMVVFNGTFAKEVREQPGRFSALKDPAIMPKDRIERRLDFEGVRPDTLNLKASLLERRQMDPAIILPSMRSEHKNPSEPNSPIK